MCLATAEPEPVHGGRGTSMAEDVSHRHSHRPSGKQTFAIVSKGPIAPANADSENLANAAAQAATGFFDFVQRHAADRETPIRE